MKGRVPRYKEGQMIADAFGVTVDELLNPQTDTNSLQEELPPLINWKTRCLAAERQLAVLKELLLSTADKIVIPN
jgi:hypothetical protein